MPQIDGTWDGGYIRKGVYVIRRSVGGRRYEVSTRCTRSAAAHRELERFESDPTNYEPAGFAEPEAALLLDENLIADFLAWSSAPPPHGKGNTLKWVGTQRRHLVWWASQLADTDLRKVDLAKQILEPLENARGRQHRIEAIKGLYSWLVSVKRRIEPSEDPTWRKLHVPQGRPEQWTKPKVIAIEDYRAIRKHLRGHWLDGVDVLAGTGWHVTELCRFAAGGSVERHPTEKGAWVLMCPRTKMGAPLNTQVSDAVAAAARRLRERGSIDQFRLADACYEASVAAGLKEYVTPGRFRHSVATWAINKGADPAKVAAFLNHQSPQTTKRFYATHAVPTKVPTLK